MSIFIRKDHKGLWLEEGTKDKEGKFHIKRECKLEVSGIKKAGR